jgi:hypothetical protein
MAILTTHNLKSPAPVEPQKLNQITTSIIPEAPKDAPPIVGADLTKMITTHDEPPKPPVQVPAKVPTPMPVAPAPAPVPKAKRKPAAKNRTVGKKG